MTRGRIAVLAMLVACGGPAAPEDAHVGSLDVGPYDAGPTPMGRLSPTDVSILFPLPSSPTSTALLALGSVGVGGPLLSLAQFDALMSFGVASDGNPGDHEYGAFRVVGARIDPCFPRLERLDTDPGACRPQLRLVAQPLFQSAGGVAAHDAAIHLSYQLSPTDFAAMVSELLAIRASRPFDVHESLGIHPVLRTEGEAGPYGVALRAWIVAHAGASTLARITFMRGDAIRSWDFGGFDVTPDGALTPLGIVTLDPVGGASPTSQHAGLEVGLMGPGGGEVTGLSSVSPDGDFVRGIAPLFGQRRVAAGGMPYWAWESDAAVSAAIAMAYRIENPHEVDPETCDCASCHLAGPLRTRAERAGQAGSHEHEYRSSWDLQRTTSDRLAARPNVVRAFGYFDAEPVISQRTINDTAAIADRLSTTP